MGPIPPETPATPATLEKVPPHAHLGSTCFAAGAGFLCVAVAVTVGLLIRETEDYAVALGLTAEVLFLVALGHGEIVRRRLGRLRPLQATWWPLGLAGLLAVSLAQPRWLWVLLWFGGLSLWLTGLWAVRLARRFRWRMRRTFEVAALATLALVVWLGPGVTAASWVGWPELRAHRFQRARWFPDPVPPPGALLGERGVRDGVWLLRRLGREPDLEYLTWFEHQAAPALILLLGDEDASLRLRAAGALGELKDRRAVEPLLAMLAEADAGVRRCAARALGEIGDARAVEPLAGRLQHDANAGVRQGAALALSSFRDPRAVEPLAAMLGDANPNLRQDAALALGEYRDLRAVAPLIEICRNSAYARGPHESRAHLQAYAVLGRYRDPRAVKLLVAALDDANLALRPVVVYVLGEIGDPRAIEPLIRVLAKDPAAGVRERAAEALRRISFRGGRGWGPAEWQQWWDANKARLLPKESASPAPSPPSPLQ